ncbi:MAG: DUF2812 domain-containing protein [Lachnospiraceae bacterium]|nr:DUF2812 domain-containing protein [Lachnospiraceae bacterium]
MKKCKLFVSLLKERDWLEDMARQGWMLKDMTWGILYHFEQIDPCEKVFEIERFAITANPSVSDLTAKAHALDITSQFGWEQVTHDEDMNYYFVKDKAGDETDEFYDDMETRRERAERYRKHFCIEAPRNMLSGSLMLSILYLIVFFLTREEPGVQFFFMWLYIIIIVLELLFAYISIRWGQQISGELCMSRSEWELHKKYSEKKRFNKVQQLRSYLQEKSEFGLSLKGYENGLYLFEEDTKRYNYFIDTKSCLKKRLKEDGLLFTEETKDIQTQSLKWYETSIANAAQYGLKPVAVVNKHVLIYKRPYSDQPLPWENGNTNINYGLPTKEAALLFGICFLIGVVIGVVAAMFLK